MSGLCVAIALLRSGITDVTVYEKANEVGGTSLPTRCGVTVPGLTKPSRCLAFRTPA
jgi:cation diffusion facilitator CzcD-associated flavoprotein CzcO